MTFTVLVLMPAAFYVWAVWPSRRAKYLHAGALLTAFVLVNVGIVIAYKSHSQRSLPHVYSVHSWFGIACLVLLKTTIAEACLANICPTWKCFQFDKNRHRTMALSAFALGVVTMLLGFMEQQAFVNKGAASVYAARALAPNFIALLAAASAATVLLAIERNRQELMELIREKEMQALYSYNVISEDV